MKLMDKYILKEYLTILFYCLFAFCMLQVIFDLFSHLSKFVETKTAIHTVVKYYMCHLAPTLEYLAPSSLLLATLYTLWQLTRHNELTAMRACGISFNRIMLPFIIVGIFMSLITSGIKEFVTPKALTWTSNYRSNGYRLRKDTHVITEAHYINVKSNHIWDIDKLDTGNIATIHDVAVKKERNDGSTERRISTHEAKWMDQQWWFFGGKIEEFSPDGGATNSISIIPEGEEMTELKTPPLCFADEIRPFEFLSSLEIIKFIKSHPQLSEKELANKKTDLQARIALPWACFIVALFAVPAGAKTGRQNPVTGIFIAIGFFFAYYFLIQVGLFMAKRAIIAPWLGAWIANIVFFVAGMFMIGKMK